MQHGTKISPTLGASWKVKGTWIILGTPFIQLLGYNFSFFNSAVLSFIFYLFKNLWVLLATPDCTVQCTSFPLPLRGMLLSEICWGPILGATSFPRPLGRINGQKGCRLQRAKCIATAGQTLERPLMGTDTWKTQRMRPGSLFQLLISLSRICPSDASRHKGPFVLPSWEK